MDQSQRYYSFLDGFRALGLMMILVHHMCVGFDLYNLFNNSPAVLSWIYFKTLEVFHIDLSLFYVMLQQTIYKVKGILGVQIFLIISGFLITRTLLKSNLRWGTLKDFYLRRLLRIYPAYILLVILSISIFVWQTRASLGEAFTLLLRYSLLLQNYFPRNMYLEHTWTLVIFEQFYFFCPLIILAVFGMTKSSQARLRILSVICMGFMLLGAWGRFRYLTYGKPSMSWPLSNSEPYFTILYHPASLAVGCLLALWESHWTRWPKNKLVACALWIVGVTVYFFLFFREDWGYHWGEWYYNIFGYVGTVALMAAAYQGVATITRFRFFQWLGRHSYGIYLWHILVLLAWTRGIGIIPPTFLILGYLFTAIAAGVLSTKTIERYFLNLRERFLSNPKI